ncbi:hypothetical protein QCA50_013099 [Cerrena zonata]|uniref:Uncharacterized protein n=1 Tax=Cerrena zonata TaxID=2478898 RepID=A0AAW0FPW3_9APHY
MANELTCGDQPAWPSPEISSWYEANKCVLSVFLGVLIWDIATAVGEELKMFENAPFRIVHIIYILARVVNLVRVITALASYTVSGLDSNTALKAVAWIGALSAPLNALLFLVRVNSVYHHSRLAAVGFIFLWLLTLTGIQRR